MEHKQVRPDTYIMDELVPEWTRHFLAKAAHYRDKEGFEPHTVLGERGQFADIWRKIWPLKKAMWDGEELGFEGKREILMDLIGHCFLSVALIDRADKLAAQARAAGPHESAEDYLVRVTAVNMDDAIRKFEAKCGPGGHDPIECSCELTPKDAPGHPSKAIPTTPDPDHVP